MSTIRSITLTAAAVAMLSLSLTGTAFSEMKDMSTMEHRGGHGHMMDQANMDKMDDMMGMCLKHADKAGLSEAQITKLKPLHREMEKKQVRFKADLKIAEIDLMEIMEVKDFDLELAKSAIKKCAELKTAHHLEMVTAMKEVRTLLTDDQYKKIKTMMAMQMTGKKTAKRSMKK